MDQRRMFYPKKRMILLCDFDQLGFAAPEMTKTRRVVVLRVFGQTALIVPLSATQPRPMRPYHSEIAARSYESVTVRVWAKCDALTHVDVRRLQPVFVRGRKLAERLNDRDFRRLLASVVDAVGASS